VTAAAQLDRLIVWEFVGALDSRLLETAAHVLLSGATEDEAAKKVGLSSRQICYLKEAARSAWNATTS
jgi:hypothetical protein